VAVPLEAMISPEGLRFAPGGFKIILKNVKIHAKKVKIKRVEK
jgi:CO dehydrogenase/acetyl-CoA synthase beta subunit